MALRILPSHNCCGAREIIGFPNYPLFNGREEKQFKKDLKNISRLQRTERHHNLLTAILNQFQLKVCQPYMVEEGWVVLTETLNRNSHNQLYLMVKTRETTPKKIMKRDEKGRFIAG